MTPKSLLAMAVARIGAYAANEDPLAAAGNTVALVLASNTPFYPIYVLVLAGSGGMPWLWLTLLVFPFFLAVPAVSRHHPLLGRSMLSLSGTANTVLCTWLLGENSGTELFLIPCITLASLLFRAGERLLMLILAVLPLGAYYFMHGRYGPPPFRYSDEAYASLFTMNAVSVGTLSIFLGIVFSRLYVSEPKRPL